MFILLAWHMTCCKFSLTHEHATAFTIKMFHVKAGGQIYAHTMDRYHRWKCIVQDHQRGAVIGEQTFGKGVVQYFFRMEDGSGLKLTVAKYLTPNFHDVALQGGLHPDILCTDTPKALLPSEGLMDQCVKQGLRYLRVHGNGGGFGRLHASR
jgi:hypothetical protein